MTDSRFVPFTNVEDVIASCNRMEKEDTPAHRRDLVRAISFGIEGLEWSLRRGVLKHSKSLTSHEAAALAEESYKVDDRGNVNVATSLRLVIQVAKRLPDYHEDLNHPAWTDLKAAVEVRNRLVHPKSLEDLTLTDDDISQSLSAFFWLIGTVALIIVEIGES